MASLFLSSFILGIAFCAPPGVITAETIRRGMARGFRPALSVQLGSLIGDTTWATIALTSLAILIQNNSARLILSLVGIILMLKLAWDAMKDARNGTDFNNVPISNRGDFASGAALSLSNPFNIVFWTGIGASVFAGISGGPQPVHFVIFFSAFLGGALLWCFFMAGLVAWGRQWMTQTFFRWLNVVCSLTLAWFALQLGVQTIQGLV
jgi:chemosensory pili system protein ChpE